MMENEKKGLFAKLLKSKKDKKCSCCGGFEIEEINDEENVATEKDAKPKDKDSCCKN